jgi:hypothetical protein
MGGHIYWPSEISLLGIWPKASQLWRFLGTQKSCLSPGSNNPIGHTVHSLMVLSSLGRMMVLELCDGRDGF